MSNRRRIAVLCGALLLAPSALSAQVMIGRLLDADTKEAIDAATILLLADDSVTVAATMTDSAGAFMVAAEEGGRFRLVASRLGYPRTISEQLRVLPGDTLRLEFSISAGAILLDPVTVTSRRRRPPPDIEDFYARSRRSAFGTFITRERIEKAHAMRATDLLRTVPGIQLGPSRFGSSAITMRGCVPMIIVDGVRAHGERSIDNLVTPMELEGLEIYKSGATVPPQYGGLRTACGAILIWTRRGP